MSTTAAPAPELTLTAAERMLADLVDAGALTHAEYLTAVDRLLDGCDAAEALAAFLAGAAVAASEVTPDLPVILWADVVAPFEWVAACAALVSRYGGLRHGGCTGNLYTSQAMSGLDLAVWGLDTVGALPTGAAIIAAMDLHAEGARADGLGLVGYRPGTLPTRHEVEAYRDTVALWDAMSAMRGEAV